MKKEFEKEQNDNQIDDAFLDMPDMEDDEKFRQWLEEEYLKEADAIEESLFDGRKFEDNQDIVEKLSVSRESFYQRAREEGLLEDVADEKAEDEKNTEEAVPESTEKKILEFRKNAGVSKDPARDANRNSGKRKYSYVRFGRIAGIAGLCLICVFAASMSSEANRKYLVNSVRILSGNDSQFISYNDDSNENASTKESDAIADIEEKLDIKMPEFYYRPYGMEYMTYEIRERTSFSKIEYEYKDNILLFYIDKQNKDVASDISSLNGMEKIIDTIERDETDIIIKELRDEEDESFTYAANWTYEGTSYTLSGKIELDELKKIVKEMKF
ncbi:MAG: DUF4367 domain-containing protein [Blautia sp.]|uniref:DUF4367 domain-containing protein n=1 Tax=Blautia sp. TaxID=1955243 RepID=UPI002590C561|nr:DUF4367 domain-containing protein [Blautia sp.]MCI7288218.1 DUF4367 domain-containing protein [Blautia sp.]